VQRRVEKPLSKRILAGEFGEGDTVLVDLSDGEYVFSREEAKVGAKV
jgi:ATP-dependent Clp protease ATP-binding subunit ClpC